MLALPFSISYAKSRFDMSQGFEEVPEASIKELTFDSLEIDDAIIINTASGSNYRLLVKETDEKTLVTVERQNEQPVVGDDLTSWEAVDPDLLFDLRGSCKSVVTGGGIAPFGTTDGHFIEGERAWLGAKLDGQDRTLITSEVQSLQLVKAES